MPDCKVWVLIQCSVQGGIPSAVLLHPFGIDHEKLTYRFQGRDFRLTDVSGEVVKAVLA